MFDYNNILEHNISNRENYREFDNRIVTEQARYPLSNITDIFKKHILSPNYQRNEVWKDDRKSKLIESFMMNIPIPPVFLYEINYAKYEVVDGRQRISTLLSFYDNKFKLTNMEIFDELNNLTYSELPQSFKDRLDRRFLSAIILLKESTSSQARELELKQFIFERLNTGGEKLEPQEIRVALYSDSLFTHLLKELVDNNHFRTLYPMSDNEKNRKLDQEMILRFFAYKSAHHLNLSLSTKDVLNKYMAISPSFTENNINILRKLFNDTISFVADKFGDKAFFNSKNKPEKMLYDSIMIASAICIENNKSSKNNLNALKLSLIKENLKEFNGKYTSLSNVRTRINIISSLFKS